MTDKEMLSMALQQYTTALMYSRDSQESEEIYKVLNQIFDACGDVFEVN